jgi:hypothetical protein
MPDTPGLLMPWKLNFQQALVGEIVIVAIPPAREVVWR